MGICSKGMISVWDTKNLSKPFLIIKGYFHLILDEHKDFIYSIDFISNDAYVVSGFADGYVVLYDIKDPNRNIKFKIPENVAKRDSNLDEGNSVKIL